MLERLKSLLDFSTLRNEAHGARMEARGPLPSQPVPKVVNKQQVIPSYLRTATPNTANPLQRTDRQLANTDITTLRTGIDSRIVIRDFVRASPDLSAAVAAYVRVGITSGYTAIAKNLDGTFNRDATQVLAEVITRLNILNDYSIGYDDGMSIRSLAETWSRELLMHGGMAGELVLDKARLPYKIQPLNVPQIKLYPSKDGNRTVPKQVIGTTEIDLDIPTFFMLTLDQDTLDPYPISPLEPAIQSVLFSADFLNDIRRIVKKAIHPRTVVTIDEEKFRKSMPVHVQNDQVELQKFMDGVISAIEGQVNNLQPEQSIVIFDSITIDVVDHGNTNLANEYNAISGMIDAKMSTGAKTLPTVLGQSNGTSNTASAEVLLFMKYVEGTVWAKLNEMFSKVFTLAVRLLGHDVYIEFAFNAIDLRPDSELEAFKAMKQSRILAQLSLGMVPDEEACIALTGHLPPAGYKNLSGTGFMPNTAAEPVGNGYNGASNDGSTLNQNLKSDAPKEPKSQNRKATLVGVSS